MLKGLLVSLFAGVLIYAAAQIVVFSGHQFFGYSDLHGIEGSELSRSILLCKTLFGATISTLLVALSGYAIFFANKEIQGFYLVAACLLFSLS